MLENQLQETFARHEVLVPDGSHIIDRAADTARTRRRRRRALSSTAAAVAIVLAVVTPAAVKWAMPDIKRDNLLPVPASQPVKDLAGRPLNFLLLGLDKRAGSTDAVRSDSVMIVHVPADRSQLYIITVERDVLVKLPGKDNAKLTEAYAVGGFALTAKTVTGLTGVHFDGGASLEYDGMKKLVGALGGVHMCIDQAVASDHYDANGAYHTSTRAEGVKPFRYNVGCRDLRPWEALDYARERYGLPQGSYDRDRHGAQLLAAILKQVKATVGLTDVAKLMNIADAVGPSLVVDTGRFSVADLVGAVRPALDRSVRVITTPLGGYHSKAVNGQSFEVVDEVTKQFYAALRDDRAAEWLAKHGMGDLSGK